MQAATRLVHVAFDRRRSVWRARKKKGQLPEEPPLYRAGGPGPTVRSYFLAGAAAFAASARIESAALFRLSDALLTAAAAVLLVRSLA